LIGAVGWWLQQEIDRPEKAEVLPPEPLPTNNRRHRLHPLGLPSQSTTMMHNSRAVGLRVLALTSRKTPLRSQLRSVQSSSDPKQSLIKEDDAPKHTPDYTAMADYRTSYVACRPRWPLTAQNILAGADPGHGR
jgi:hypothetical protein